MIKYTVIFNDAPKPWQIGFQDGATPTMEGIVELHDQILFYLIAVLALISWLLSSILYQFSSSKNLLTAKYENHGTCVPIQKYSKFNNKFKLHIRSYTTMLINNDIFPVKTYENKG